MSDIHETCLGCGQVMFPQTDGGYAFWHECLNPECEYEEEES